MHSGERGLVEAHRRVDQHVVNSVGSTVER
jgi:hypothetical protein